MIWINQLRLMSAQPASLNLIVRRNHVIHFEFGVGCRGTFSDVPSAHAMAVLFRGEDVPAEVVSDIRCWVRHAVVRFAFHQNWRHRARWPYVPGSVHRCRVNIFLRLESWMAPIMPINSLEPGAPSNNRFERSRPRFR